MGMIGKGKSLSNHERPGCVKWKSTYKETIWKARFTSRYHQAFGFGEGIWKGWVSSDHGWLWGASLVPDVGTTVSSGGQSDGDWQHPRASGEKNSASFTFTILLIFFILGIFLCIKGHGLSFPSTKVMENGCSRKLLDTGLPDWLYDDASASLVFMDSHGLQKVLNECLKSHWNSRKHLTYKVEPPEVEVQKPISLTAVNESS